MTDYERVERDYAGVDEGVRFVGPCELCGNRRHLGPCMAAGPVTLDPLLAERKKQYHPHGDYIDVARVSQDLKRILAINTRVKLHDDQAESLHMICNKLARIVNGNPDLVDHWADLSGYAQLVANRLRGGEK